MTENRKTKSRKYVRKERQATDGKSCSMLHSQEVLGVLADQEVPVGLGGPGKKHLLSALSAAACTYTNTHMHAHTHTHTHTYIYTHVTHTHTHTYTHITHIYTPHHTHIYTSHHTQTHTHTHTNINQVPGEYLQTLYSIKHCLRPYHRMCLKEKTPTSTRTQMEKEKMEAKQSK